VKVLHVGETFAAEHPLPAGAERRTVSFANPHVARGEIDGNTVRIVGESPGFASYVVEFLNNTGRGIEAAGEQFRVLAAEPAPPKAERLGKVNFIGIRKGKKRRTTEQVKAARKQRWKSTGR